MAKNKQEAKTVKKVAVKKKTKKEKWRDTYFPICKNYVDFYDTDYALYNWQDFSKWLWGLEDGKGHEKADKGFPYFRVDCAAPFYGEEGKENACIMTLDVDGSERPWQARIWTQTFRLGRSNVDWVLVGQLYFFDMMDEDSGVIYINPFESGKSLRQRIEERNAELDEKNKRKKNKKKRLNLKYIKRGYIIPASDL